MASDDKNLPHVSPVAPPVYMGTPVAANWSTGLCDCTSDMTNCCITCWCPCITFGQIAEIIDRGTASCGLSGALYFLIGAVTGCPCIYSCFYRAKLRSQYSLPDAPCGDCFTHCFCELCALCQEYRELKNRGFDVPLGWQGNMQAQNPGYAAPPVMPGMQR